jgi:acetamidase/formamidase
MTRESTYYFPNVFHSGATHARPCSGRGRACLFRDPHAAISDGIITGTGIECSMNVRARITLLKDRTLEAFDLHH